MARQERAVRTRNTLIESAAELFDREGFETASLATISARAGVSNGALHFHFASKAALAGAVWETAAQRLWLITDGGPARECAVQILIDASHALVRGFHHDVVLRAGFGLGGSSEATGVSADLHRTWQEWVEAMCARARQEGALAADVSAQDAALAVVAAVAGFEALGEQDEEWLSAATLTAFWELLLPRLARESVAGGLIASGTGSGTHPGPPRLHGEGALNSLAPVDRSAGHPLPRPLSLTGVTGSPGSAASSLR
ncbi:ScbR family autoregulator-binding transcription factor [Streptomyces sp. NBC_00083]|uniref:ScbR family autoregulator-binding transcription factor n=1 Tax=Streptomyces sp. NBC_00083 TaxID=2975647 RepID=UPI00224FEF29|nr:ScbR family autoregulator-binding transcription factor [Streptomyces sp. NBC_00083]MCX5384336.1 ScbR family autoregulator-binding transcription factor [Streptomyces sp. NBC_00083]